MEILLTRRELDIISVLWESGPAMVADVRERLADELAYTTVLTVLRVLEEKGYVGHKQVGKAYHYYARIKRLTARKSALRRLTEKLFGGSAELLLTHLVSDRHVTEHELMRMSRLLDARLKETRR